MWMLQQSQAGESKHKHPFIVLLATGEVSCKTDYMDLLSSNLAAFSALSGSDAMLGVAPYIPEALR
jgi:hypothetical protein